VSRSPVIDARSRGAAEGRGDDPMPLRLRGISKRFGDLIALDGIGFDLGTSEILALLGENGAGKTTLLNIICGHYKQDKGEIRVFGNLLPPASPRAALSTGIGSINQHSVLAYNETGLDNIILGTEALWKAYQSKQGASKAKGQYRRIWTGRPAGIRGLADDERCAEAVHKG
jgi:ABC-type uncharacterized transport system ATPase subunit